MFFGLPALKDMLIYLFFASISPKFQWNPQSVRNAQGYGARKGYAR